MTRPGAVEAQSSTNARMETDAAALGERYKWYALWLLFTAYVFNFIDRSILYILQESIKRDLGLSDTQLGLLSGFAFALFYATLGIPLGRLADRTSRSTVIAAAVLVWSAMTMLCGAALGFWTLLFFRIGVGIGEAGCSPPAHSLISDYFPPRRRGTALALYAVGIHVGIMVGFLAGGWVNEFFGWRQAFVVVGLPGVLFSFLLFATLKEPPRGLSEGRVAEGKAEILPTLGEVFRLLWSRRSFRHLSFAGALHAFVAYGVGGWLPPFFIRIFGLSSGVVGTALALMSGVLGGIGVFLGGYLGDRLGAKDQRWYPWICAASLVLSLPFGIAAILSGGAWVALLLYCVPALLSPVYNAPNFAMTQGLVPLRMRAAAAAVLLFVLNLIGMGLGPTVVGGISDLLEPSYGEGSLRYALLLTYVVNVWSAIHYMLAARTLREELALAAGASSA